MRWIAELIGYPPACGGLLMSGGNMANVICFMAARAATAGWDVRAARRERRRRRRLRVYGSTETHTWLQKAADMAGLGTDAIRWIPTDRQLRMDVGALRRQIEADRGRRRAVPGGRHRRVGEHRRRRPAARDRCPVPGARRLVPRRRRLRRIRRGRPRGSRRPARASASPIRWPSIPTSGSMRRSKPAARWCAIRSGCAPRSPITRPTTTSTSTPRTTSTTARRTRAASGP